MAKQQRVNFHVARNLIFNSFRLSLHPPSPPDHSPFDTVHLLKRTINRVCLLAPLVKSPPPLHPSFFSLLAPFNYLGLKTNSPRASIIQIKTMFRFWRAERSPPLPTPFLFSFLRSPKRREISVYIYIYTTPRAVFLRPRKVEAIKRASLPPKGGVKRFLARENVNESGRVIPDNYKVRSSTKFTRCVAAAN